MFGCNDQNPRVRPDGSEVGCSEASAAKLYAAQAATAVAEEAMQLRRGDNDMSECPSKP